MNEYIKAYSAQPASSNAIIMLPDIWGQTAYANDTATQFAARLGLPVYVLDYFYVLLLFSRSPGCIACSHRFR